MTPVVVRRWEVAASFVLLAVVATSVALWNGHRIDQAEKRISRNTDIAVTAKVKAARAENFVENFKERIQSDKVCTESNRGMACRALFERLAQDITTSQRHELACAVAKELQWPQYKTFCVPQ